MIIINQRTNNESAYILTIGTECSQRFKAYAQNETDAINLLAKYLIDQSDFNSFFDALEVNIMASSKRQTMQEFAEKYDLHYCPKYNIYLPDLGVEEVSI